MKYRGFFSETTSGPRASLRDVGLVRVCPMVPPPRSLSDSWGPVSTHGTSIRECHLVSNAESPNLLKSIDEYKFYRFSKGVDVR
jgi:hypothetical protein